MQTDAFVAVVDGSENNVLHPAQVLENLQDSAKVQLNEEHFALEGHEGISFYFHDAQDQFVKQCARVETIERAAPHQVVGLRVFGETQKVERRSEYRIPLTSVISPIAFGEETSCIMLDVSEHGFAVVCQERHPFGGRIPVTVHFRGWSYSGFAIVRNERVLDGDRMRYGCQVDMKDANTWPLIDGLVAICQALGCCHAH